MPKCSLVTVGVLLAMAVMMIVPASAQSSNPTGDPGLDAYIEAIRADLRSDKINVITETMQFMERDASAFWPIYRRYEAEQRQLNEERIQVIKNYANNWDTLTNSEAKKLAERSLELEGRGVDLRKRYFAEFSNVLPGIMVAKFFQLEYRLDLLIDLRIASELPALLVVPSATTSEASQTKPK